MKKQQSGEPSVLKIWVPTDLLILTSMISVSLFLLFSFDLLSASGQKTLQTSFLLSILLGCQGGNPPI
jgi:hypothetical protein